MSNTSLLGSYGDNSGSALMFRNRIINGDMRINQRYALNTEVIFSGNTGPYFFTDRWFGSQTGNGVGDEIFLQSMSLGAGELVGRHHCVRIRQYKATGFDGGTSRYATILEPSSIEDLRGQVVTLSFYHRAASSFSTFTGNWNVRVNYDTNNTTITSGSASSGSFELVGTNIIEQTFRTPAQGVSDNWTRSSYTFTIPSNAERLSVVFYSYNNGTNNAAFDLTGVQLEAGPVATPFERRPFGTELALCQRYYEKGASSLRQSFPSTIYGNATWINTVISYKVTKRAITNPSLSTFAFSTNCSPGTQGTNISTGWVNNGIDGFTPSIGGTGTPPASGTYVYWDFNWSNEAEL